MQEARKLAITASQRTQARHVLAVCDTLRSKLAARRSQIMAEMRADLAAECADPFASPARIRKLSDQVCPSTRPLSLLGRGTILETLGS